MKTRIVSSIVRLLLAALTLSLAVCAQAQFSVLYNFPADATGYVPNSGVVLDSAGNVYGTTLLGGGDPSKCNISARNCGTVYELSPSGSTWTHTVLAGFTGDARGGGLFKGLVRDAAGNLYGTTQVGGNLALCGGAGCGVVFKLSKNSSGVWKETVIHTFTGPDGSSPFSNLLLDAAGNLYGTTQAGGNPAFCDTGCGVAFQLSHNSTGWHERVLYGFHAAFEHQPFPSGLARDAAGNLYGVLFNGGNAACSFGCGSVFRLSPTTSGPWTATTLYTFTGGNDGALPVSDLTLDAAGNLYGTAEEGGTSNDGVVYKLSPGAGDVWTESVLFTFNGTNGKFPRSGVFFDSTGNLYGSAYSGIDTFDCPSNGCGLIYKLTNSGSSWTQIDLHTFNGNDGAFPSELVRDPSGFLYGTAQNGSVGFGLVFRVGTP